MSWPSSPRTRSRPIGPTSPIVIFPWPRTFFDGGRSDRSARWPSRVWMTNTPAARQASRTRFAGGRASSSGDVSLPSASPKPPGYTKSRWKSIINSAVVAGSNSNAYGSASTVAIATSSLRPPDLGGDLVRHDSGASRPVDRALQCRGCRDQDLFAAVIQEVDGRLHLRAHAALRKLAVREIAGGLARADGGQQALIRLPEMPRDLLHAGR